MKSSVAKKWVFCFILLKQFAGVVAQADEVADARLLLPQAETTVGNLIKSASLFNIEAEVLQVGLCQRHLHWFFNFVSLDEQKSGTVEFSPNGAHCELTASVSIDSVTQGMGFLFLDLNLVKVTVTSALIEIRKSHPAFSWNGHFRIYQPLAPNFPNPIFLLSGAEAGHHSEYAVDTTIGKIIDDSN